MLRIPLMKVPELTPQAPGPIPGPGLPSLGWERLVRPLLMSCLAAGALSAGFPGVNGEIAFCRSIPEAGTIPSYSEILTIVPHGPDGPHSEGLLNRTRAAARTLAQALAPAYSPDGSYIAYASNRRGGTHFEILVRTVAGQNKFRKTTTFMAPGVPGSAYAPAWAPDGLQIAYLAKLTGAPDHACELRVFNLVSERTLVAGVQAGRFAWSPDGTTIVFTREGQLWAYRLATGQVVPLTHAGDGSTWPRREHPAWSPDGKKLAFTQSDRAGEPSHLWWMNLDGSQPVQVSSGAWNDTWPEWSPDGRELAFVSDRSGHEEIYVRNAVPDGLPGALAPDEVRLTHATGGARNGMPNWRAQPAAVSLQQ